MLINNLKRHFMLKSLGIFSVLIISVSLISCLNWILEKPTFVIREIKLNPQSLTELDLTVGVEVHNPNRLNLTLRSFRYTVYLEGKEIGKGKLDREYLLSSLSATQIKMPITAKFKDLGAGFMSIITGEDIPYKIEGNAGFKTILGSSDFPFSKEGRVNLKKLTRGNE